MASGQLEVRPWQDSTLRGGRFELDTWLASFEQVLQSGPTAGYTQTSFLGHMEWALTDLPGVGDLVEYETRVNYVIPKYEGPVICTYDLTKLRFPLSRRRWPAGSRRPWRRGSPTY